MRQAHDTITVTTAVPPGSNRQLVEANIVPDLFERRRVAKRRNAINPGVKTGLSESGRDGNHVFLDDVCEAFVDAALSLTPSDYGDSFNIGTGTPTTIRELAQVAREIFHIENAPEFSSMQDASGM